MRNDTIVIILFISVLFCSSCAGLDSGLLFSRYSSPGSPNFYQPVSNERHGDACRYNILGLIAFGDASVDKAMQNGNIDTVRTVDRDYTNILQLFSKDCVKVTGGDAINTASSTPEAERIQRKSKIIQGELKRLKDLRERGVLNDEEYSGLVRYYKSLEK